MRRAPRIASAMAAAFALAACSPEPQTAPRAGTLVSANEVRAFYLENPVLFAARKVYAWRSIVTEIPVQRFAALAHPADMDAVEDWLKAEGVTFRSERLTRPAEDVPLVLLPRLAHMRPGEIAILSSRRGALVLQLVEAQEAPMTERQAAPLIEQYLAGRKRALLARIEARS